MSENESLDPDLAALFRNEVVPDPPEQVRARLLARLEAMVPSLDVALPRSKATSVGGRGALGSKALALATATFVAGGILGAVAVTRLRSPLPPRVVYVDRPSPSLSQPTVAAPPAVGAAPEATAAPSAVPSAPVHPPAVPSSSATDTLTAERLLIDGARTKLARGDPEGALAGLQEHARRFPDGRLDEEREALSTVRPRIRRDATRRTGLFEPFLACDLPGFHDPRLSAGIVESLKPLPDGSLVAVMCRELPSTSGARRSRARDSRRSPTGTSSTALQDQSGS